MKAFRILLIAITVWVVFYTLKVGMSEGWNIIGIFFGDMRAMNWPGQFNTDFMSFLILSGLWVAWRNHFSPIGILLGVIFVFGGILVLAPYLLYLSFKTDGDMQTIMLGPKRAGGS